MSGKQPDPERITLNLAGASIELKKVDGEKPIEEREFSMTAYDKQTFDYWFGKLVFDTTGFSMSKSVIPALFDHDHSKLVGEISSLSTEDGKLRFSGNFLDTPDARTILSAKKLTFECSICFFMEESRYEDIPEGDSIELHGETIEGPVRVIRATKVKEVSFTHYGAVPGTSTDFSATSIKEENMPGKREGGDAPTPANSERELLGRMIQLSGDKAFAAECFSEGMNEGVFMDKLIAKFKKDLGDSQAEVVELTKERDKAKQKVVELQQEIDNSVHAGSNGGDTKGFMALSEEYATNHRVSLSTAMAEISRLHPDVHEKFKEGK